MFDCIIIGGGPAGLNGSLVLGRAGREILLLDENKPRNAVTQESHGFITRDGIKPAEFKNLAKQDLAKYPNITIESKRATSITQEGTYFIVETNEDDQYKAKKVIISSGLKDSLPAIEGIHQYYGKSFFSCPFCDGYEMRNQPLVVIAESEHAFHVTKMLWNWSKDVILCTNGHNVLSEEQLASFEKNNIKVYEEKITSLQGKNGQLEKLVFADGKEVTRVGGIVGTQLSQASPFLEALNLNRNAQGGIETDTFGRSSIPGIYACGDATLQDVPQLIIAAAQGSKTASGVIADLISEEF
ncbi:NAD(P)/FAD-dependent oxidoreductase [Bacillus sp. B1-b2]|uniref:NAD(P)/FAD-dependent oxidoreductase n=1 Tax=Bacillus sp. B1-b2 TaxID=2653201 RepID=UPI00126223C3|nr:NAD(P)/FAD-dependent oxidoreductase [Bacillus sp. B1-b2]KAB7671264.1 NAD(P)/FAD-dependent oxidoreductase [Bacillus sp. B1-b2]